MNTIVVWLLITVSGGLKNMGNVNVVGQFPSADSCMFVLKNIPNRKGNVDAKCIQATLVKP